MTGDRKSGARAAWRVLSKVQTVLWQLAPGLRRAPSDVHKRHSVENMFCGSWPSAS